MVRKNDLQNGLLDFSNGCLIMGILNVTPDSFSDGGDYFNLKKAVKHAVQMQEKGAAIIDIGPESTRPGAKQVSSEEQIERACGVIEALRGKLSIPISIDTYMPEVANAAINAGASIINDITALENDEMAQLAAEKKCPVILMHMQGTPQTMQQNPTYKNVVEEVINYLLQRAEKAQKFGIPKERIILDPGIGFGKTLEHNLELLRNIDVFVGTDYRILLGTSRKSFIGALTNRPNPKDRIFGTAATVALAVSKGIDIIRVHDVGEMSDVVHISEAIR